MSLASLRWGRSSRKGRDYRLLGVCGRVAGVGDRGLIPTVILTPDHERKRGGTFVAKNNANGKDSRPRRRPDGRWEARHWSDGGDAPVSAPTDVTVAEFLARYEDAATYTMKRRSFET